MKKDKNVVIQIPFIDILSQFSNPQYLSRFKNDPKALANQIDDLQTMIKFSMSQFQQKSKVITKKITQYNKGLNTSRLQLKTYIEEIQFKVNTFTSNENLAYHILKKTQKPILQEAQYALDCRRLFTQIKLKFLQSQNIHDCDWNSIYNPIERCLDIGRNNSTLIKLSMKLQKGKFMWKIIKILYNQNQNPILNIYYDQQLAKWMKTFYPEREVREANILSTLLKSVDYTNVALLYMEVKQFLVNKQNLTQQDKQNYIYYLFQQNQLLDKLDMQTNSSTFNYSQNKKSQEESIKQVSLVKSIKIRFNLVHSQFLPSVNIIRNDQPLLNIQFFNYKTAIKIKIVIPGSNVPIRLTGYLQNIMLNIQQLKNLALQTLKLNQIFKGFYQKILSINSNQLQKIPEIKLLAQIQGFSKTVFASEGVQLQKIENLFQAKDHGLYYIHEFCNKNDQKTYIFLKISKQLVISCRMIQSGYINKLLNRPGIKFNEAMMHIQILKQILNKNWDWDFKLQNVNLRKDNQYVHYVFNQQNFVKHLYKSQQKLDWQFHQQKRKEGNSTYLINIKISTNFQKIKVFYSKQNTPEEEILPIYFKKEWNSIKSDCQQNRKYLPLGELMNTIYYLLNHFLFDKVFNQPNMDDTRNMYDIQLMSQ